MDYILTNSGAVLMTQVAAGRTVIFTRVESGSGYSASPAVLQNVVDKKQDMFLDEVIFENRQAVVKTTLSNVQLEEEYQLRQVGVYAKLEGDEADTLVIIGQQYNGEKIPSYGNGIIQIEYDIAMKISGTGNVTIEGVGTGYVTKGQFLAHLSDNDNPHKVTAKQLGLENVPNVDTDDQTPTFTEAEERENIASKEKLSVLFGKIRKWFSDLKEAAFCSVANNLVTTVSGSVLDARQGKELQDQITGLYSDLGGFEPIIDETGKITGYKTTVGGADTVFPFSEIDRAKLIDALSSSGLGLTIDSTPEQIYNALKAKFPDDIVFFDNGIYDPENISFTLGIKSALGKNNIYQTYHDTSSTSWFSMFTIKKSVNKLQITVAATESPHGYTEWTPEIGNIKGDKFRVPPTTYYTLNITGVIKAPATLAMRLTGGYSGNTEVYISKVVGTPYIS